MKQLSLAALAGLGLVAGAAGSVQAQTPFVSPPLTPYVPPATSPFYRPAISPYLGLALPGNRGLNYFNIVQPQLQTATALGQLQYQVGQVGTLGAYGGGYVDPATGLLITGHASSFQNHWGYFQNWRGAGFGGVGGVGGVGGLYPGLAGPRLGLGAAGTGFLRPGAGLVGQNPTLLSTPSVMGLQTLPTTQPAPGAQPGTGTQPGTGVKPNPVKPPE